MLPALLILCASCTAVPERDGTLPPSCPGSDDPAYAYTTANDVGVNIQGLRPDAELVALTTDGGSSSPSFTPDGTSIVFARAYPGQPRASSPPSADSVWIMNADGSDPAGETDNEPTVVIRISSWHRARTVRVALTSCFPGTIAPGVDRAGPCKRPGASGGTPV